MDVICFEPLYQERVWGGRNFESLLGRTLPEGQVIGESWEVVDRPEAMSALADGTTLRALIEADPTGIMGEGWDAARPFPILVKWLDCQERLSLQVHPPASVADELQGEPKTENWFVAHAAPGAALMAGLKPGVTREQFEQGLEDNTLEPLVHRVEVEAGCSLFVPSGRIHAIDAGNLILEIQQNSDTTYRVYDWGRVGLDGKPRQLHVEQSMRSIDFDDFAPEITQPAPGEQLLADSDVFRLRKLELAEGEGLTLEAGQPQLLGIVSGEVTSANGTSLGRGANALVPARSEVTVQATQATVLLVTDQFNRA